MTENQPLAGMRRTYARGGLAEADLAPGWPAQFARWFAETAASGLVVEPNAMVLATADAAGRPSARTVLLKGYDERGFVLFTNLGSRKGADLAVNPQAALVFGWVPLERQVVVAGGTEPVSRQETAAYFASRPRGSQLGAWASAQSRVVGSRAELEAALAECDARWPAGTAVPVPDGWGGIRVRPDTVEFWQGRPDRLHDRLRYRWVGGPGAGWVLERLAP